MEKGSSFPPNNPLGLSRLIPLQIPGGIGSFPAIPRISIILPNFPKVSPALFSEPFPVFLGGIGMGTHRAGGRGNRPGESRWEWPWNRRLPSIGGTGSSYPRSLPLSQAFPGSLTAGERWEGVGGTRGTGRREKMGMGTDFSSSGTL